MEALPDALWIRGNGERWTANPGDAPDNPVVPGAIEAARAALGPQLVADLAALPTSAARADMLICHGSPVSDVRSFLPSPADDEPELLDGVAASPVDLRAHASAVPATGGWRGAHQSGQ